MEFILLTHKYLKQFAMKELRAYTDSLVRVRVKYQYASRQARLKLSWALNPWERHFSVPGVPSVQHSLGYS